MSRRLLLAVMLSLGSLSAAAELPTADADLDSMAQRMRACDVCHGAQGRSTPDGYFPRIAGKPAGYLYQQLLHFREGSRRHTQMAYLLDRQSPEYLMQMATYFAELDLPYPPPPATRVTGRTLAHGERLALHGDAERDLPACVDCHGAALTGLQPSMPGLLGLPHDYLAAQLGAWRTDVRRAREPDCMALIVRRMDGHDIEAVSAWLAAQPLPARTHAPEGEVDSEIVCGTLGPLP